MGIIELILKSLKVRVIFFSFFNIQHQLLIEHEYIHYFYTLELPIVSKKMRWTVFKMAVTQVHNDGKSEPTTMNLSQLGRHIFLMK